MISVQLDWKPNAQFAGLLVADHGGLFADRGLEVDIIPWQVHTDPVAGLDTPGRIAVSEDNLAIRSRAAGNDVIILGAMLRCSPLAWIVRADSPLTSFADFAGTTVGVHVLWARDAGYQVYSQVLSTSRATYHRTPEPVEGFMHALWEGWGRALTDTAAAASTIVDDYLHESTARIQQEILEAERPWVLGEAGSGETLGAVDERRLQASIDLLHANEVIPERLDASSLLL